MVATALIFAFVSALFELILLLKWAPLSWLNNVYFTTTVHVVVILANLAIHFGTVVGTMTAITAGLVSFGTMPLAIVLKTFWRNWTWKIPTQKETS